VGKNTIRLADKKHWDTRWESLTLPIRVNKLQYSEYRISKLFRKILEKGKDPDIYVLEVGCGGSKWMHYFYHDLMNKNIFGFDYSESGCKVTKKNLEFLGDTKAIHHVTCGDVFNLPFKNGSFDIVYSLGFIEHFENPYEILELISDLLKPKGLMITLVPNYNGLSGRVAKFVDVEMYKIHRKIRLEELKEWHKKLNFTLKKIGYFGSFSLTAGVIWTNFAQRSLAHKVLSRILTRIINIIFTLALRIIPFGIETRFFSPYLVAVGRKSLLSKMSF
jgi:SAM-dependent methyltransferase